MDFGALLSIAMFLFVGATMIYRLVRNRGLKGALFGAPTAWLAGEIDLGRRNLVWTKLKVHVLEPRDPLRGPHVGLEVSKSTVGSWQMTPVSLTHDEARQLAETLTQAASQR